MPTFTVQVLSIIICFLPVSTFLFSSCLSSHHSHLFHKNISKKQQNEHTLDQHMICVTIPKSGTHLLHKCLKLLNLKHIYHPPLQGVSKKFIEREQKKNTQSPPNHYKGVFHIPTVGAIPKQLVRDIETREISSSFWTHWPYTEESETIFNLYGKANFFMIRDPRDQLVSMAFMVYKNSNGDEAFFETVLMDLIDGRQRLYIPWAVEIQSTHPLMWELGVSGFYHLYLPWMDSPNFQTIKFENLVGTAGGGLNSMQIEEIQKIGRHLGLELSKDRAYEISQHLFGGTFTFREGKIGSWHHYFTLEIKELFKQTPGACQLLIDLGYESDDKW